MGGGSHGTGHAAAIEHLCNGVGGYAPDSATAPTTR